MKKQNLLNWIITILFLLALAIIYCFWGCKWDLVATIAAVLVAAGGALLLAYQNKRIKDLSDNNQ